MRKSYWFLGHHQTIIAGSADTEGPYDLAEGCFPAGTQIPPHRRYSDHFYVLERTTSLMRRSSSARVARMSSKLAGSERYMSRIDW